MNRIDIVLKTEKYILKVVKAIQENLGDLKYHHLEAAQRSLLKIVNSLDPKIYYFTFKQLEQALNIINHILF